MHRPTIALLAILLLGFGLLPREQPDDALAGACLRVGMVMAILWFAQPQLKGLPRWLIAVLIVGALIAVRWPRALILLVPVAAVLWLLRPRTKGATASNTTRGPAK